MVPAQACASTILDELRLMNLGKVISLCSDLPRTGCVLTWLLFQLHAHIDEFKGTKLFSAVINLGARLQAGRRRSALPVRQGEMADTVKFLLTHPLNECLSEHNVPKLARDCWMLMSCYACNSLVGWQSAVPPGVWGTHERLAVQAVGAAVDRLLSHGAELSATSESVEKEMKSRRVSYTGEEISTCHKLTVRQITPALPPEGHGGSIDLVNFVSDFTRHMLFNPIGCVLEDDGRVLPKLQGKIHIAQGEEDAVADLLVKRGICSWTPLDQVLRYRDQYVLNGLFGVQKSSTIDSGEPVLRVIMNLVPSNSVMLQLEGATNNLPSIMNWMSLVADGSETIRIWQSDMSNAFYLFSLPEVWKGCLSFNIIRSGKQLGFKDTRDFALSCCVLPMGWLSSVSIMQEVSERLLLHGSLDPAAQLVKNRPLPLWMTGLLRQAKTDQRSWWHVYLDNFCAGQLLNHDEVPAGGDALHLLAEEAWAGAHVISAAKKRKKAVQEAEELGALIQGKQQMVGPSGERLIKTIHATLWLIGRPHLSKRLVQVIAGRWIHILQFRRPGMGFLEATWVFIGKLHFSLELVNKVRRELFSLVAAAALLHTYVGAGVANFATASDASMSGGAAGITEVLTPVGEDYVHATLYQTKCLQTIPVMVLSLFNGIGGSFRCYDILGLSPLAQVSFDIHEPGNRVTARRWPQTLIYKDVKTIDEKMVQGWLLRFVGIKEIHIWAGFPCTDLSAAKAFRAGLKGPQSGLFYELKRVIKVVRDVAGPLFAVKWIVENVASMAKSECEEISRELDVWPYFLNCSDAVPMNRPRLCWCSEELEDSLDGLTFTSDTYWTIVEAIAPYPACADWIEPGVWWPGFDDGEILPTAMKAIVRHQPPARPAGLSRCTPEAICRWKAEHHKFPPYHYQERFIFWRGNNWRLADSSERELLLGYGWQHTSLCFSASKIKQSKAAYENERLSLLGDSFSIYSFVIAAAALCKDFMPKLHYQHMTKRMGLAPGFRAPWRAVAPLKRSLQYGSDGNFQHELHELSRILLTRVNHTGSDVRVSTGEILNYKAFPRQGVEADWWTWKPTFKFKWNHHEHINLLEMRAILQSTIHTLATKKMYNFRLLHLTDSYVCLSTIAKGRSGSHMLNRILKTLNAHLLVYGVYLILAHVESTQNPTDGDSRAP